MLTCLNLTVILCLLQVLCIAANMDISSFLIWCESHNKCIAVESRTSVTLAPCDPHAKEQQFRWASNSRILSLSHKLCLGTTELKDLGKVVLFECDETSDYQHWECKNETIFGLKDHDLHLNCGNGSDIMIYKDTGLLSRWRIYGTQDGLCSKVHKEIFTQGGNAVGGPCQFPFKYNDKWYIECTRDGRPDGQLWCATETDYDETEEWGICPPDVSWDTDPVSRIQYRLNTQAALTWHQARKSCQQQGADLLSITELHEQSYISGLTSTIETSLWIGLNSLDLESGWQWSNGYPFRYLRWAQGHPSSEPEFRCATLNATTSKWESNICTKKLGYICCKGNTSLAPLPSTGQPSFCQSHWVSYAGNCYYLERNMTTTWGYALAACRNNGGDLASIHNIEEQSFIIARSGYLPTDVLWIGMNDKRNQMLFEWSDHSRVTFTQWQSGEPHATSTQEDCVLIRGEDGKWSDHMCENTYGYICKKKPSLKPPEVAQDEANPGCKLDWIRFGLYCYHIGAEAKTFDDAKQLCSEAGANLVDVADRYENAFLVSLVGFRPEKNFWIGFSNTEDRHIFKWTTRRKVAFTHFNVGMPDRKQGCVAFTTGLFAGLWDVISCSSTVKYICKKAAEGVSVTTVPPTTTAVTCASGWKPVGKRNVCFKIYKKEKHLQKTWHEAHDFCHAIGADLISLHSHEDLNNAEFGFNWAWIGLSSLYSSDSDDFAWTDGSAMDYEKWGFDEPEISGENCVIIEPYGGRQWGTLQCEDHLNWICQIKKGIVPQPDPVVEPIVYNTTKDGWIIYNDTQYFINTDLLPMEVARAYCQKNFGELASITRESERKFLLIHMGKGKPKQHYIGMVVNLDKSFSWLDGTPVTYTAWENNQPDFANNDENCVSMYNNRGKWIDINCGIELPSICKRRSSFINTTMVPSSVPKGGCAPEWLSFQGKCYKTVVGNDTNWHNARTYCINQGGNLVSITSFREQNFLTTMMLGYNEDFWIGMNDINQETSFVWTDGKGISYTNWAKGHPIRHPEGAYAPDEVLMFDCVLMVGSISKLTGLWKVEHCKSERAFICKRNIDPQILIPSTTGAPKVYHKIANNSYKLVAQMATWDEARNRCQMDDADLASIQNPIAQAFVTLQFSKHNQPAWIGLNSNVTNGRYMWVDNWMMSYTNWGTDEPKDNYGCVYMDADRKWKTAPCSNTYYYLCKRSTDIAPTVPPQLSGNCPELRTKTTWIPFRGHCYYFLSYMVDTWAHASVECQKIGATLVSIQDRVEGEFIQQNLEVLQDSAKFFWIGLYKSDKGEWMWLENNVVDYTNWDRKRPNSHTCVNIHSQSGYWSTTSCQTRRSYICKAPKVITTTETSPSVASKIEETPSGYASITVPMVLTVVAILGLGIFLFSRKRKPITISETPLTTTAISKTL